MPVDSSLVATVIHDAIIERCLRGDQRAWETVARHHWRRVFNIAYKFVGRYDEAEDLTQEIFLKTFKALRSFDRRANFQTWLISIRRNLCVDYYGSARKERQILDRGVDVVDLSPVSPDPGPLVTLERRVRRERLYQAMDGWSTR